MEKRTSTLCLYRATIRNTTGPESRNPNKNYCRRAAVERAKLYARNRNCGVPRVPTDCRRPQPSYRFARILTDAMIPTHV